MLVEALNWFISMFSTIISWVFSVELISEPKITLGQFLLAFAFLGLVILLIFRPILDRSDK